MKPQTRIALVIAGIAALIAGAALMSLFSDDEAAERRDDGGRRGATAATGEAGGVLLRPGALRRMNAQKGQIVRFRARSAVRDELHVHGYDLYFDLPAGRTVSHSFRARLDGVFEIELHGTGEQVAELRVGP